MFPSMFKGIILRNSTSLMRSAITRQPLTATTTSINSSLTSLIQSTSKLNLNIQQQRYATMNQIKRGGGRIKRPQRSNKTPDLDNCPIRKGVILRVMIMKPKKPNSAQRKVCRVRLTNGNIVSAYIGGEGHNAQEHSVVFVRGGRVQDLPGIKYHCVRGALDLSGVANRATSRSKYGAKKPLKST